MFTRSARVAGIGALLLAAVGCGPHDTDVAREPGHSTTQEAGRSASGEKAQHAYVDPCTLLSQDERSRVVSSLGGPGDQVTFGLSDSRLLACQVYDDSKRELLFEFGYSATPRLDFSGYPDALLASQSNPQTTPLEGVGDEAVHIQSSTGREAFAGKGDYTVFLFINNGSLEPQPAAALLASMLEKATPGMLEHPIHLPDECPKATSPQIKAALGTVIRAAGIVHDEMLTCAYASGRKKLTLASYPMLERWMGPMEAEFAGAAAIDDTFAFDYAPRAHTVLLAFDTGPSSFTMVRGPVQVISSRLDGTTELGRTHDTPGFDQGVFRAVDKAWVRAQIKKLRT